MINVKYIQFFKVVLILTAIFTAIFTGWKLGNFTNFRWGEKVAFFSNRDGNLEVYVMLADGSLQTRLTFNNVDDGAVTISRDGALIAFDSARDSNYEVYKMNIYGQHQMRLTNDLALDSSPGLSPDIRR